MTTTTQLPSYRTIGGSLVTLARTGGYYPEAITCVCGGCGDTCEAKDYYRDPPSVDVVERSAKEWAQDHAENCRALPRLPEGVIHRAITQGGGHIDITTQGTAATATCTGCPETRKAICNWEGLNTDQERLDQAIHQTREWARDHAAACPFIPGGAA